MYREVSRLVIYRNLGEDSILFCLSDICQEFYSGTYRKEELITRIYHQIHRLLDLATIYGFDDNLWHNYLTFILITLENMMPRQFTWKKDRRLWQSKITKNL